MKNGLPSSSILILFTLSAGSIVIALDSTIESSFVNTTFKSYLPTARESMTKVAVRLQRFSTFLVEERITTSSFIREICVSGVNPFPRNEMFTIDGIPKDFGV